MDSGEIQLALGGQSFTLASSRAPLDQLNVVLVYKHRVCPRTSGGVVLSQRKYVRLPGQLRLSFTSFLS